MAGTSHNNQREWGRSSAAAVALRGRGPESAAGFLSSLVGFALLMAALAYGAFNSYQEQALRELHKDKGQITIQKEGLFRGVVEARTPEGETQFIPFDDAPLRQLFAVLLTAIMGAALILALRVRKRLKEAAQRSEQEIRDQAERAVHDLKTPLSALRMISEYPESLNPKLQPILRGAADRVEKIISELERKALSAPDPALPPEPFSLMDSLETIAKELRWHRTFRQVSLAIKPAPLPIIIKEIPQMEMERHLMNLIINGMESCLENQGGSMPEVEIEVSHPPQGGVVLEITDNGPGLTPEFKKRYFQRGFSKKKGRLRGRGLYFARKFAESFRGTLTLEDRKDHSGAKVTLSIPEKYTQFSPGQSG